LHTLMSEHPEASEVFAQSANDAVRLLVIGEALPRLDPGDGPDQRLWHLLRALRAQGFRLTYIAREGLDRKNSESALQELGIRTYADDPEKLAVLGSEAKASSSWTLQSVLAETKFAIAILAHSFERGISIPEQYLDDIRRHSPATRIAVWLHDLHQDCSAPVTAHVGELQAFEKHQDWLHRQDEALQRADFVIAPDHDQLAMLQVQYKDLQRPIVSPDSQFAEVFAAAIKANPQPVAEPSFSILQVETLFRDRLAPRTGLKRFLGQLECYVAVADLLLREKRTLEAREQLRHVFGRLVSSVNVAEFVTHVFVFLKRCYRELGDATLAGHYGEAARQGAMGDWAQKPLAPPRRKSANAPVISLIVPTYNRLPILRKCLAALEAQTFPAKEFEVIVIDDGSSDGSEEFLRRYPPAFRFQYLRQRNAGTGAARRNGVAHASGDYLLLMNDDTICDPDVIEQHVSVQRKFASQRWAVLGSFEYPHEARRRALTHYFCVEPFMFPQVSMEDECPYGYSHFITCNLSVRRDAVMEAGSFDSTYKLSEDTEMGLRLFEKGYRVLYHPAAHAWHDHLPYPARNLIRRARVYGADYFFMFRNHPRVMKEWSMPVPLTGMDEANAKRVLAYTEANRLEVEQAVAAIERWDEMDFEALLAGRSETAAMVLGLFRQAVPAIHWFYLYETMYQTMVRELNLVNPLPAQQLAVAAGASGD